MYHWKYGKNEVQEFYETGKAGKHGTYALVFRNHGGKQWFGMVGNSQGGFETLTDAKATQRVRVELGRENDLLGGPWCLLSDESEDYMMRMCEQALTTGAREF